MQDAFVVRLSKATDGSRLVGSVEEVDTGKQARFVTENELIEFLQERFAQAAQGRRQKEGRNERKDDFQ
jgi:hypothetical protein